MSREGSPFRLAHHMMKMTATVQATFDYESEADALESPADAFGVTSMSPRCSRRRRWSRAVPVRTRASGRRSGWRPTPGSLRAAAFRVRAGLFVSSTTSSGRWMCPLFFVRGVRIRTRSIAPAGGLRSGASSAEGFKGERPTMRDWETHLSTLFPEVRLKRTSRCAAPTRDRCRRRRRWARSGGGCSTTRTRARPRLGPGRDAIRSPSARRCAGRCRGRRCGARFGGRRSAGSGARAHPDLGRGAGAPSRRRGRSPAARAAVGVRHRRANAGGRHARRLRSGRRRSRRSWSRVGAESVTRLWRGTPRTTPPLRARGRPSPLPLAAVRRGEGDPLDPRSSPWTWCG